MESPIFFISQQANMSSLCLSTHSQKGIYIMITENYWDQASRACLTVRYESNWDQAKQFWISSFPYRLYIYSWMLTPFLKKYLKLHLGSIIFVVADQKCGWNSAPKQFWRCCLLGEFFLAKAICSSHRGRGPAEGGLTWTHIILASEKLPKVWKRGKHFFIG